MVNPPSYEEMVKAGMHFGRKRSIFNPRMKPYVYILRDNIYIIDLIKTKQGLIEAANFLHQALKDNKLILFVGLSQTSADLIKDLAESLKMPFAINRWLGGTLTNFKTIFSRVQYWEQLEKEWQSGALEKYTKKEKMKKAQEREQLKKKFGGLSKMTRVPDVLFVASVKDGQLPIREARAMSIKTVGIINTESDPQQVDFPIPANDNARRSLELILRTLKEALAASAPAIETSS